MKILLLTITSLSFICTQAQIRIGLQGGYNNAHLSPNKSYSDIFYSYSTNGFRGIQAGVVAEMIVSEHWIFRPALLVNGKGTRLKKTGFGDTSSRLIELHYLEVPIAMVRKWNIGKSSTAFTGAGMYLAQAFRGVEKGEGTSRGGPYYISNSVEFSSRNRSNDGHPTIINPFDYGFNILVGVQRESIQLLVSYEQGLQRVFPRSLVFEERFTNRVFSLSAVYLFKTKR